MSAFKDSLYCRGQGPQGRLEDPQHALLNLSPSPPGLSQHNIMLPSPIPEELHKRKSCFSVVFYSPLFLIYSEFPAYGSIKNVIQ